MGELTPQKYRELFRLRAMGELDDMECTKTLYHIMEKIFKPGMKVLDVPVGVGHYYRKIKDLGNMEFYGIDLDAEAIAIAKEVWIDYHNTQFSVQSASDIDYPANFFDIVYCYNLLLHLKDYKLVLKELFRVTKKYLIVRSLFDNVPRSSKLKVHPDYKKVYKSGTIYYNTYTRYAVKKFVESLGDCKVIFLDDNVKIPEENLRKQEKILSVDDSEFAKGTQHIKQGKKLKLNYEVMLIIKL